jgi:hypothetical protein
MVMVPFSLMAVATPAGFVSTALLAVTMENVPKFVFVPASWGLGQAIWFHFVPSTCAAAL